MPEPAVIIEQVKEYTEKQTAVYYFPTRFVFGKKKLPQWFEAFRDSHLGFVIFLTGKK